MKNVNLKKIVKTACLVTLASWAYVQEASAECCMCINGEGRAMRCLNVNGHGDAAIGVCKAHCGAYKWRFGGINRGPC